jgi:colanic acid/amylovoran biosynthesis glycosyltransferase
MKGNKIAVVLSVFPKVSETFITNQITYLIDQGHDVEIFCLRKIIWSQKIIHGNTLQYRLLDKTNNLNPNSLSTIYNNKILRLLFSPFWFLKNLSLGFALIRSLNFFKYKKESLSLYLFYQIPLAKKLKNFDIIHIHFADNAVPIVRLQKILNFESKLIVSFHGYDVHEYSSEYYTSLFNTKNIKYTSNTSYTAKKAIQLGFNKDKISILAVGLDTNFFQPSRMKSSFYNLLFVGRFVEFKAPLNAIKITEALSKKINNIRLTMIGGGPEMRSCQDYVSKNNLEDYVHMTGAKSQSQIVDIMNSSNLFIYPGIICKAGRCENQGLVLQEAQAMGLPVICSDVGGIKDGMIDNITGFLVEEKNLKKFVEKIMYLYANPEFQKEMAQNAREFVCKHYDSKILGEKLLDIYFK